MSLTVQSLRSTSTGIAPETLLPGQICFNLVDRVIYVGDGTSFRKKPDGTQTASLPGLGWFATSLDSAEYILNPAKYGFIPENNQVIVYNALLQKPIWANSTTLAVLATNVVYNPLGTGLPAGDNNVQVALNTTAETAITAKFIAEAALPKTGGSMTGFIDFVAGQPVDAGIY